VELANRVAHVEKRQQARSMPGGACRKLGALDQGDVGPALFCQMIERADPDNPTADDQDPNMCLHELLSTR